jgi:predicted DNA-binding antitoxin AbrB/MazE fold protein
MANLVKTVIPAIYEKGVFRPLEVPVGLEDQQPVQLYIVPAVSESETTYSVEENIRFVRETMGSWHVEDEAFRHWLAEEASLFDD